MRFAVLVAYADSTWDEASPEEQQAYFEAHHAFESAVQQRGALVAGAALEGPGSARTLRHEGGRADGVVLVSDGPYAETVEQVGGLYLVDLPDLGTAMELAALLPATYSVEVRPVMDIEGYTSLSADAPTS